MGSHYRVTKKRSNVEKKGMDSQSWGGGVGRARIFEDFEKWKIAMVLCGH